jgi:hypothetical protein
MRHPHKTDLGLWRDDLTGPRIIKRNERDPLHLRQRPLSLPKMRTGKQYNYEGKR